MKYRNFFNLGLIGLSFFTLLYPQYHPQNNPFDWVTYTKTKRITSITEGYSFIYFGTENGGILRYHIYADEMDYPLTVAQGLSSNQIQSVHFDFDTGILWVSTSTGLDYSHMREGGWTHVSKTSMGITARSQIDRLGSSQNFLWAQSRSMYLKLDRVSGILISVMSIPNELDIRWSPTQYDKLDEFSDQFTHFNMIDGWMFNHPYLYDPHGREKFISTYYPSRYGDIWVGISDGTILKGDYHMEIFYPITYGLLNSDVSAMVKSEDGFWIGSKSNPPIGLTYFDKTQTKFDHFEFELILNMTPQKIYSILPMENEMWFGGSLGILVLNEGKNYWRLMDETKIQINGRITNMTRDSDYVWIGSNRGISRMNPDTKQTELMGFEREFWNENIYDLENVGKGIWIGTKFGLYIYDPVSLTLYDFRDVGTINNLEGIEDHLTHFWEIEKFNNYVYVATKQGLISFNQINRNWKIIFKQNEFTQEKIHSMVFNEEFGFFGINSGLLKFDFKYFFMDKYSYPFLGQVNALYLEEDILWLGTSMGLTKYLWKND